MTRDLDSVPVSQASPLELLRMAWRLWRGRRENALVLAGYPWRPRRRIVRVAFWIAVAAAWVVSLGVLPLMEAALGDPAFDAVSRAFFMGEWFRVELEFMTPAVAAHVAVSVVAMVLAATLLLPSTAFRVAEGEGLAELRLPPMANREVAFGSAYWGLWAYAAVLLPFWLVQGYFAGCAMHWAARGFVRQSYEVLLALLLPATLLLLHGTALIGALGAYWDRGGVWIVRARDALWEIARGTMLLLPWAMVYIAARELAGRVALESYVNGRITRDGESLVASLVVAAALLHALCLLWALAKRRLSFAGERFFAPLDPEALPRLWWLPADRAARPSVRWTAPEFSRRLLWIPAVAAAGVVIPLLLATTTSRDLGLYRVTPGYAFAGGEIAVEYRGPLLDAALVATPGSGEEVRGATWQTGEIGRIVLPPDVRVLHIEAEASGSYIPYRQYPQSSGGASVVHQVYHWRKGHTPYLGTPWEAVRARLVRLPVAFCLSVLLAALLVPRGVRPPARHAMAWAAKAALPALVPLALVLAAHALPHFRLAVDGAGLGTGFHATRALVILLGPLSALLLCGSVAVLHVAAAADRRRALALWIAVVTALLVAWNTAVAPTLPSGFFEDGGEGTALLIALSLFALVPMLGGADGLRQRLHDEALHEAST